MRNMSAVFWRQVGAKTGNERVHRDIIKASMRTSTRPGWTGSTAGSASIRQLHGHTGPGSGTRLVAGCHTPQTCPVANDVTGRRARVCRLPRPCGESPAGARRSKRNESAARRLALRNRMLSHGNCERHVTNKDAKSTYHRRTGRRLEKSSVHDRSFRRTSGGKNEARLPAVQKKPDRPKQATRSKLNSPAGIIG